MSDAFQDWARVVREKAIEAMARAWVDANWYPGFYDAIPAHGKMRARGAAAAALDALLAELPGMGLQVVPEVAGESQMDAARDWSVRKYGVGIGDDAAHGCWTAMCAAAPNVLGRTEP